MLAGGFGAWDTLALVVPLGLRERFLPTILILYTSLQLRLGV